ncbi:MAG TPA: glycosyltransferase [Candidatus Portnoybacteria bacterium]|nr:glycosyltransferase [Candidatus Portnoybacteria bacterium]
MKILTNIRDSKVCGISQTLNSFLGFIESRKKKNAKIIGVDVSNGQPGLARTQDGQFSLISSTLEIPQIGRAVLEAQNLGDLRRAYRDTIEQYKIAIKDEKPDIVLVNGTYYLPWCLYLATKEMGVATVLHYHGSISKETEHWQEKPRKLFKEMEKSFDSKDLSYIFPSELTKQVVENEVFGHAVKKYSILPNAVPLHFFEQKVNRCKKNIGIICRWAKVKNTDFFNKLAKYNQQQGNRYIINVVTDLKKNALPRQALDGLVKFRRPVCSAEMGKFYSKMGIVLSPSVFETYGNVPQEAIASGVPALVSSNMGVAEIFKQVGLAELITDFASLPNAYEKIKDISGQSVSQEIREKMKELLSPDIIHHQMLNILESKI